MIAATDRLHPWAGCGWWLGLLLALGCGDETGSTGDSAAGAIGVGVGREAGIGATGAGGDSGSGGGSGDPGGVGGGGIGGSTPVFITTTGQSFEEDGQRYTFVGTNFWQGMNLGAAGASGDRDRLDRELGRLQTLGITNLRVMAASEGPDSEPSRLVPAILPTKSPAGTPCTTSTNPPWTSSSGTLSTWRRERLVADLEASGERIGTTPVTQGAVQPITEVGGRKVAAADPRKDGSGVAQ